MIYFFMLSTIIIIRLLQVVKLTNRSKLKQTQIKPFPKKLCLKYLEVTVMTL